MMLSKPKTLEQIIHDLVNNKLSKAEVNTLLISLIESSTSIDYRVKCMEEYGKYVIRDEENFKILENYLISDENHLVRNLAAKILFYQFPKISFNPMRWVIQNEKSIYVLNTLFNLFKESNEQILESLETTLLERLTDIYEVNSKEVYFLLEIESQLNPDLAVGFFKPVKRDRHIIALDFAGRKLVELPSSIGALSHLEYLNLWDNSLTNLPDSIESLSVLQYLYLDWNKFEKFPNIQWHKLKSLRKLSYTNNSKLNRLPYSLFILIKKNFIKKYINEGITPEEAPVLGLLEFLTGMKLKKLVKKKDISSLYACNYIINLNGNIIGIYLYGYHSFQINLIPEQLRISTFIEELVLRDQNIEVIPEFIKNLKSLKCLDLMRNNIKVIPEFLGELLSLEVLDLGENNIQEIPDAIKNSNIDLWI